jgi:hypothetical protein
MVPNSEQGTRSGSSAYHATGIEPGCDKTYDLQDGTYGRNRLADYNLGCKVEVIRVHVWNTNSKCGYGNKKCALKKFDLASREHNWGIIGRHMMPDPGSTVTTLI